MPFSYKTKVLVVGSPNSGKETFFKGYEHIFNSCCNTSYWTIGLSIKIAEYSNDQLDLNLTIALWDINPSQRFQFLFPNFFRGASGAILFLDYSSNNIIEDLNYWLNIIRENSNNIPIFLVGVDNQIKNRKTIIEILNYIRENNLERLHFLLTPKKISNSLIINQLSKKIINTIQSTQGLLRIEDIYNVEQISGFNQFIKFFSNCPICGLENHKNYLAKFYFDNTASNKILKEFVLNLMEKYDRINIIYENDIKIGIPCCSCFNKFFLSKNSDTIY